MNYRSIYEQSRKALVAHFAAMDKLRSDDSLWKKDPVFGMRNICLLCRWHRPSSKSFSRDRGICLSCSMRGNRPRWLDVSGGAVTRWRGILTMREFAPMCGFSQPRLAVIEGSAKVGADCAIKLANGLVASARNGNHLGVVIQEWPLFCTLADRAMVEDYVSGEVTELLGDQE